MRYQFRSAFLIMLLIAVLSSCNSQKKVQRRSGYLLVRNSVKIDNKYIPAEDIEGVIQQKATPGRISLVRPGVWIYETLSRGKQTKFKQKIKDKYGTQPVILDTSLALKTEQNIRIYLRNKGFHHPTIRHEFRFKRANASAYYYIIAGSPYKISSITYHFPDPQIGEFILADTSNSLIRQGSIFDSYKLDDERDRISQYLRNHGYFDFSKSNITFLVDTHANSLRADLNFMIRRLETSESNIKDTLNSNYIRRYFIHDIYIMPDVEQSLLTEKKYDTLEYHLTDIGLDTTEQILYFIHGHKSRLKPIAIANAVMFRSGQEYKQESITRTYKRLISLPIVRSANIYLDVPENTSYRDSLSQWLDCTIKMTRNPVSLFSLGTEGTNSSGRLGLGINLLYQNKNIFRRAETFNLKINTGAEFQGNAPQLGSDKQLGLFNAIEYGFETGIDFPRLLLPSRLFNPDRTQQMRTSVTAGYGFESRSDYARRITTFSGNYHWNSSISVKHILTPLELNFVRIQKDSTFQAYLLGLTDPQFVGQYNDHLLTMIRYSMIFSNQARSREKHPFYLRINTETSGNTFHLLDHMTGRTENSEGYYSRFGVRYAQYFRSDVDYRKYWNTAINQVLAFRLMFGGDVPYGNSQAIPFEKSFWLGGANDMRGWRLRSLGPGGYTNDSIGFDRTGDLMAYSSIEYRFPIYSFLNGGLFADAGNIWLREDNPDFPGGKLKFSNIGKQIALDSGLGLRFDFSFFIVRIDWALRIKNPQYKDQWFHPEDFRLRKAVWNLGIGYPF